MSLSPPSGPPGAHFEQLGVTPELLRRVLDAALARGGDDCDLYFQHSASNTVSLSDRKVSRIDTSVDLGMGVRVVLGDQVGYAYSEDLSADALIAAARAAAEIAATSPGRVAANPSPSRAFNRSPELKPWAGVDMATRVALVRQWEKAAFERDDRIRRVEALLRDGSSVVMVVRPDGRCIEDYRPGSIAMVSCVADNNGVREGGSYNVAGRAGLELFDPRRTKLLVNEAVDRTLFLLDAGKPPAGEMPVVLAAGPSAILLHEAIGHGMEADFNRKGKSIYADKLNARIASDEVTIVDDGTIPNSRGAVNIDDEGNEGQRTVLVEDGILRSYLHDEISAQHYNVGPTGSGRRQSFRHPPLPRMRATLMLDGPRDPKEIIASVEKGLYCMSFANGQVNIGGGDFSFYMRQGFLIEDGKLTKPVKDVNIIGNGPAALMDIDMVGNDLVIDEGGWTCGKDGQGVPVSQGMPTVRVAKLSVGGVG